MTSMNQPEISSVFAALTAPGTAQTPGPQSALFPFAGLLQGLLPAQQPGIESGAVLSVQPEPAPFQKGLVQTPAKGVSARPTQLPSAGRKITAEVPDSSAATLAQLMASLARPASLPDTVIPVAEVAGKPSESEQRQSDTGKQNSNGYSTLNQPAAAMMVMMHDAPAVIDQPRTGAGKLDAGGTTAAIPTAVAIPDRVQGTPSAEKSQSADVVKNTGGYRMMFPSAATMTTIANEDGIAAVPTVRPAPILPDPQKTAGGVVNAASAAVTEGAPGAVWTSDQRAAFHPVHTPSSVVQLQSAEQTQDLPVPRVPGKSAQSAADTFTARSGSQSAPVGLQDSSVYFSQKSTPSVVLNTIQTPVAATVLTDLSGLPRRQGYPPTGAAAFAPESSSQTGSQNSLADLPAGRKASPPDQNQAEVIMEPLSAPGASRESAELTGFTNKSSGMSPLAAGIQSVSGVATAVVQQPVAGAVDSAPVFSVSSTTAESVVPAMTVQVPSAEGNERVVSDGIMTKAVRPAAEDTVKTAVKDNVPVPAQEKPVFGMPADGSAARTMAQSVPAEPLATATVITTDRYPSVAPAVIAPLQHEASGDIDKAADTGSATHLSLHTAPEFVKLVKESTPGEEKRGGYDREERGTASKKGDDMPQSGVITGRAADSQILDRFLLQPKAEAAESKLHSHIMEQVTSSIVTHDGKGNGTISIKLNPVELGELQVNVKIENQTVKVEIVTENRTVREALMGNVESLKEAFQKQNLTMERFDVSTGGGNGFSQGFRDERGEQQRTPSVSPAADVALVKVGTEQGNDEVDETENSLVNLRL